ncbi:MAG TPA: hypothetical protein VFT76_02045 [Actinomycetota bacterium]|nr:hypothetical protein [Actinomycetota bacterium]
MRVYGIREIAAALGVSDGLVRVWKYRGKLPAPTDHVGGHPLWTPEKIEPWLRERRLRETLEKRAKEGER